MPREEGRENRFHQGGVHRNQGLNFWGWMSLAAAWGVILVLTIYCFTRVLPAKKKKETGLGDAGGRMQWGSRIGLILLTVLMVWLTWRKKKSQARSL